MYHVHSCHSCSILPTVWFTSNIQVPMHIFHSTTLSSIHYVIHHNWMLFLLWCSVSSFFDISSTDLQQMLGTYWPEGVHFSVSHVFAFYCSWGSCGVITEVVCHSGGPSVTFHLWLSVWVALHGIAQVSLERGTRLWSMLIDWLAFRLWFQVCLPWSLSVHCHLHWVFLVHGWWILGIILEKSKFSNTPSCSSMPLKWYFLSLYVVSQQCI